MTITYYHHPMKTTVPFLLLASAALIVAGCNEKRTTSQQLDGVQTKTAEVARNIKNYSYSQRDEFVITERAQLTQLNPWN